MSRSYSRVVAFRTDASLEIGTGHVMRCLTLADALSAQGVECHFLCREHSGHLIHVIEDRGHIAYRLPMASEKASHDSKGLAEPDHAHWLGTTWEDDAEACRHLLAHITPDWLVVDHYALDARWEAAVMPKQARLLVIDDLADRPHCADLLLDQNLGRAAEDYTALVPMKCRVLAGPQFALLRPEFSELRESSLARRSQPMPLQRLLISLGGVDKDNATGLVLDALKTCDLPSDLEITVVMGATAPWLDDVQSRAARLPWPTEVVVNVSDMAQRMATADLAIGAAGSTSWERCCLGLPTLMLVLAENQQGVALMLDALGAAQLLGKAWNIAESLPKAFNATGSTELAKMVEKAALIVSGQGEKELLAAMLEYEFEPGK